MNLNSSSRKIKNYLISKDIQLKVISTNCFYLILVVIVLVLTVISPYYYDIFKNDEVWAQYLSAKTFNILLDRLIIAIPVIFGISFIHLILLTHKFCGPLINIKNSLKEISRGNYTRRVYLRKNDFLKDEALITNNVIAFHSELFSNISRENLKLLEKINEALAKNPQKHEIKSIFNELKKNATKNQILLTKLKINLPANGHQVSKSATVEPLAISYRELNPKGD